MNPVQPLNGFEGPLYLYHGTNQVFYRFVPSRSGAQGPGIYMSDEPFLYGTVCLKLKVTIKNPFFFYPSEDSLEAPINGELIEQVLSPEMAEVVNDRLDREGYDAYGFEVQNALKAQGYDSIIMVYPFGEPVLPGVSGSAVVIAFDPDQVEILGVEPPRVAVQKARKHDLDDLSL